MQLVLTSVFQKFDLSLVDPSYDLEILQTLTIKPKNFYIRAKLRDSRPRLYTLPSAKRVQARSNDIVINPTVGVKQPLYVLYGSNTGTSESFAQRIATAAPSYGKSNQSVPVKYPPTFVCFFSRLPVHDGDSKLSRRKNPNRRSCYHRHSFLRRPVLSTSTSGNNQLKILQGNQLTMRVTLSTGSKVSKQMSSQGFGMGYLDAVITIGFIRSSASLHFVIIYLKQEAELDSCLAVSAMPLKGPFSRCSQSLN